MSLYKREYVCVKAWASAEDCIWEKENEYGKYTSCVKKRYVYTSVNVIYECVYMHML